MGFQARAQGTQSGPSPATAAEPWLKAQLRDLSPEGACIISIKPLELKRRDWLTVRLDIGREQVAIPASIIWIRTEHGTSTIGLELHLEMASHDMRTRYARWIVNEIQAASPNR